MKSTTKFLSICAVLGAVVNLNAQTVTVDPSTLTTGFMNVFSVAGPGYGLAGAGGYQFGSSWGTADLVSSFSGTTLTLAPNTIGDASSYWYTPAGGPGAVGNKIMDANLYNETTGIYTGQILTFTANVLSSTLLAPGNINAIGNGWTSVAFIKDFASDYSSSVSVTAPLVNGVFSISLATVNDPARHIQYGFETIGPDVWVTDAGQFGTVIINPVPEPTSLALAALGAVGALPALRRRNK
jgi:MYXO-CTERM domain-containing protein